MYLSPQFIGRMVVLNIINEKNLCPLWPHKNKNHGLEMETYGYKLSCISFGYVIQKRYVDLPMSYISKEKKCKL